MKIFNSMRLQHIVWSLILGLTGSTTLWAQPMKTIVDSGNGTGTTTWHRDTTYLLKGRVFVHPGDTLTIESGTVIKAASATNPEDVAVLTVATDAHILALGTATEPIIFTSELDNVNNPTFLASQGQTSLWGGIYINGRACVDTDSLFHESIIPIPNTPQMERLVRVGAVNGVCDDTYNAGIFRYVSIRYTGAEISANHEPNAITLAGIGSETEFHHVEVSFCGDDGFEFWGGNVCASYLLAAGIQDDCFDFDLGNRSPVQFIVGIMGGIHGGNRGIEIDGTFGGGAGNPISRPEIYNATLVSLDVSGNRAAMLRQNAEATIRNSVFYGFSERGIQIEARDGNANDVYRNILSGDVELNCNYLWEVVKNDSSEVIRSSRDISTQKDSVIQDYFWNAGNYLEDPMFTNLTTIDSLDLTPMPGSPLLVSNCAVTSTHPCIINTGYIGAFPPSNIAAKTMDWAADWTWTSEYYYREEGLTNRDLTKTLSGLALSPNPISRQEVLAISWEEPLMQASLEVYSLSGALLKRMMVTGTQANLSLAEFTQGVYMLTLQQNGQRLATEKLLVR